MTETGRRLRKASEGGETLFRPTEDHFRLLVDTIEDYAIFMLDPSGHVVSWNAGAEHIKGYRRDEILGQHFSTFYPSEMVAKGWPDQELETARAVGRFEDEGWRVRKDGSQFWANVIITALRDPAGTLIGFAKVTRDLTERRRREEELVQSEERFRLMVESVRDYAIFMLDPDGRVTTWNAGAERIKGYQAKEIIGKHFSRFYPPAAVESRFPEHELEVAREVGRFEDEGWRIRKDGTPFWANVVITALWDRTGTLRGFAKITRDLTERRRVESLEEESRRVSEFLAMLGHELRNPLAPIRNAVTVMGTRGMGDPTIGWARDVIERQVGHLTHLVDDLLDVSRVTTGKVMLRREALDLGQVVSGAADSARPSLEARRHKLEVNLPDGPVGVAGDPTRLAQVVVNLLNNAAKYTPAGGHVWVTLRREGGDAVLTVRDDGIGMSAELVPRVFDLFTQGDRGLDRSEGGLGIGLTLVRRLVEMHEGSVSASSAGPGHGSEFTVRLPLGQTETPKAAEDEPSKSSAGGRPLRVLVVDDNLDAAETMVMLLNLWGHDVRSAGDGPAAVEAASAQRPDVVLLDIGLPGMSGYEVAERLRAKPELRDTVLVAMTGYGQAEDKKRARQAGFTLHLVKPVEPDMLQKLLASLGEVRGGAAGR